MMQNKKYFTKIFISILSIGSTAISLLLAVIAFFFPTLAASWDACNCEKICIITSFFAFLFVLILITSLIATRCVRRNIIWKKSRRSVTLKYGDIFKLKKNREHKQFVVVPVDTQFMTQVDPDSTNVKNPCVSPETLHGKFIKKFYPTENDVKILETKIKDYISLHCYKLDSEQMQKYNNSTKDRYPIGTIVELDSEQDKNISYLLLALSEFDENNNVIPDKNNITIAINELLKFYEKKCQGGDLYIPLMGTGFSRQNLSEEDSLRIIRATVEQNLEYVLGNIHIVVFSENRGSVSIW